MMNNTTPPLIAVLLAALEADGRSAYQIARAAGVAPGVVTRFKRRERDVSLVTAAALAEVLGLSLVPSKHPE